MDKKTRQELKQEYKLSKTYMGVIKITNKVNGKIFLASYPNLKNKWNTIQMHLNSGIYSNAPLIKDWKEMGADAFTYEVLEQKATDDITDMRWELQAIEKPWLEKLQPYGERGYNFPPKY